MVTAPVTSCPPNREPPSPKSTASPVPFEAPAGAIARPTAPEARWTSTSTVGRPRESQRRRPTTRSIAVSHKAKLRCPRVANCNETTGLIGYQSASDAAHTVLFGFVDEVFHRGLAIDAGEKEAGKKGSRPRFKLGFFLPCHVGQISLNEGIKTGEKRA